MIPETGQHVKCILRNGIVAEGIVEEWYGNFARLKSLDDESLIIIPHPTEDIMLIKIILDRPKSQAEEVRDKIVAHSEKQKLEQRFEEVHQTMTDPHDHDALKTLAELRNEMAKQDRKIVAEKLREHRPSPYKPSTTPYHYAPVIYKKKSPYQPGKVPNDQPGSNKKPRSQ